MYKIEILFYIFYESIYQKEIKFILSQKNNE